MQATQKELLSTMKVIRNEVRDLKREFEKRKEETQEVISVPNRIRVIFICINRFRTLKNSMKQNKVHEKCTYTFVFKYLFK